MGLDGYNSHAFILDEFHAQKDWKLYNVLKTSQGARKQPLAMVITTAGYLLTGYPCYEMRQSCIEILKGFQTNDAQFAAIYELEEEDDWQDPNVWEKANPSMNHSVYQEEIHQMVVEATTIPSEEPDTRTKQFNQFMSAANVWIRNKHILDNSQSIDLEDFRGETCYMGVDLSAVSDLTAWALMFPPNPDRNKYPDKFVFKVFTYVPQEALESVNGTLYKEWIQRGQLFMTSGNAVDYDKILRDQLATIEKYDLYCYKVSYDQWNATQYATNAIAASLPMEPFSQSIGSFNRPTKGFEILILNGQIILDMNLVTKWCFGNAELKEDYNGNVKPIKAADDRTKKIDCVIAILQALAGYLLDQQYGYEPIKQAEE